MARRFWVFGHVHDPIWAHLLAGRIDRRVTLSATHLVCRYCKQYVDVTGETIRKPYTLRCLEAVACDHLEAQTPDAEPIWRSKCVHVVERTWGRHCTRIARDKCTGCNSPFCHLHMQKHLTDDKCQRTVLMRTCTNSALEYCECCRGLLCGIHLAEHQRTAELAIQSARREKRAQAKLLREKDLKEAERRARKAEYSRMRYLVQRDRGRQSLPRLACKYCSDGCEVDGPCEVCRITLCRHCWETHPDSANHLAAIEKKAVAGRG